jgi:hypothetical protein
MPAEDLGVADATSGAVAARIIRDGRVAAGALELPVGDGAVLEVVLASPP